MASTGDDIIAPPRGAPELKVLVLAPSGRDGDVAAMTLREAGYTVGTCRSIEELCTVVTEVNEHPSLGTMLITEEALLHSGHLRLSALLDKQPPWSDLPVVLLASPSKRLPEGRLKDVLSSLGNVTLLERPMRRLTLLTAVGVALRQRQRQLAMRALLIENKRGLTLRDHFLAMLGHELRNPLSAIVLASQTISCEEPHTVPRYQAVVSRQAGNLQRLVDDILDVSRATRDTMRIEEAPLDLRDVAANAVETERLSMEAQGVRLSLRLAADIVPVSGDTVRLEQVAHNLLSNARRFTPEGGEVVVSVGNEDGFAVLRVSDTGEGIPRERLQEIFQLFSQVDEEVRRHRGGLGLGLALVQQIVKLHGGTAVAESGGPGMGSTFVVRLPLMEKQEYEGVRDLLRHGAKEQGERRASRPSLPSAVAAKSPREMRPPDGHEVSRDATRPVVLVVEDDQDNREMLVLILQRLGINVRTASTGGEGIKLLRELRPDVCLIDIGLPDIDGYEVGSNARELLGGKALLLALTGYGHPEAKRRTKEAGFDVHLTKPVDIKKLRSLIASGADRSRGPEATQ